MRRGQKRYRKRYPDRAKKRDKRNCEKQRERFFAIVNKYKDVPCLDCGGKFPPYCMDFDHVRGKKKFDVSSGWGRNINTILEEIAKCELICSNCHRIRTNRRSKHHREQKRLDKDPIED